MITDSLTIFITIENMFDGIQIFKMHDGGVDDA